MPRGDASSRLGSLCECSLRSHPVPSPVGRGTRVRAYALSIVCNPSPQPSPNGRGSVLRSSKRRHVLAGSCPSWVRAHGASKCTGSSSPLGSLCECSLRSHPVPSPVGRGTRVRAYALSIVCNPSPQPSPNGRGSVLRSSKRRHVLAGSCPSWVRAHGASKCTGSSSPLGSLCECSLRSHPVPSPVGRGTRVRAYALSIVCNPSPPPSPNGRGSPQHPRIDRASK